MSWNDLNFARKTATIQKHLKSGFKGGFRVKGESSRAGSWNSPRPPLDEIPQSSLSRMKRQNE